VNRGPGRPGGRGGPREAIDAFSHVQHTGPAAELRDIVAPLPAAGG
jgi:hypothetical protein